MRRVLGVCLLLVPLAAVACFQIDGGPYRVSNTEIRGSFTYEHKPISRAPLQLEDETGRTIAGAITDLNGGFLFPGLKPGKYKLRMLKPSYESFDIKLNYLGIDRTKLKINFYADFCNEVSIVPADFHGIRVE